MTSTPTRTAPAAAVIIAALILALAPIGALAQGPGGDDQDPPEDQGSSNSTEPNGDQGNQTGDDREANRSDEQQTNRTSDPQGGHQDDPASDDGETNEARAPAGGPNDAGQDRQRGGPDAPRDRTDPVQVRDHASGFRTEAAPGSQRPEVDVDVRTGRASVDRPDVAPLSMQLDALVEYDDEDGDGAYDLGEPVLRRIPLRSVPVEVGPGPDNGTRDVTYDLGGDGRLVLRFDVGTAHGPQIGAKFDVRLEGLTFQDPGTRVALGVRVESPAGLHAVEVDGHPALTATAGRDVPFLSWVGTVQVDGATQDVGWSIHVSSAPGQDGSDEAIVYWSYGQGEMIVHDPVLGITGAVRDLAGQPLVFTVGAAGTLAVLTIGYLVRRRRRL